MNYQNDVYSPLRRRKYIRQGLSILSITIYSLILRDTTQPHEDSWTCNPVNKLITTIMSISFFSELLNIYFKRHFYFGALLIPPQNPLFISHLLLLVVLSP
mgnify:CR=1 FL=1